MAEGKTANLFRKSTMSRIASADELDHYVKVTNPSAWAVLVAALLLVAGILIWALVAVVPITVERTGVSLDDKTVYCWVDKHLAERIKDSDAIAWVGEVETTNVTVDEVPMSLVEVESLLEYDYIAELLKLDDWNYMVTIQVDEGIRQSDFTLESTVGDVRFAQVSITVSEKTPIVIVMGDK